MKNIQAIKMGTVINVSIDGKLQKKACGSVEEANDIFKVVLEVKENPTEENIKKLRSYLNEKTRIALLAGLETDPDTGEVYLAGFNTPVPATLVEVAKEYHDNGFPLDAIINFWKLLMINPDTRVRTSLFDFIKKHDFVLTDSGYMVVYKAVYRRDEKGEEKVDTSFTEFISNRFLHVKKSWKESPKTYVVYKDLELGEFCITKKETAEKWDEKERNIEFLGNLADLFNSIFNSKVEEVQEVIPHYTDMYTRTMDIVLGQPVVMPRHECDSDPAIDCSYGLHCGATKYVENHAQSSSVILVCYVNPANVVAVPDYDHSKMRVSEYFPFAVATFENKKIDIVEQKYFEDDYSTFEQQELEALVAKVRASEKPIETAINAEEEQRPMAELMKILETRLLDISE